jgi:hypothetical protein
MNKFIVIFIFLLFSNSSTYCLNTHQQKKEKLDTIEIVIFQKDTSFNYSGGTIFIFKNDQDSIFLILGWENLQYDMGKPGITPFFKFKLTAPDGIYKIIINHLGQPLGYPEFTEEIIHLQKGKAIDENEINYFNYNNQECDTMKINDSLVKINGYKLPSNKQGYRLFIRYKKQFLLKADGYFKEGILFNGKYFLYDCDGILTRIYIFRNGKYIGDGQIE